MKDLTGRKIKGFYFESNQFWHKEMKVHIGEVGVISSLETFGEIVRVDFKSDYWYYPLSEIEKHLVPKDDLVIEIPEIGEGVLMECSNDINFFISHKIDVLLKYKEKFISIDGEGLIYSWKYVRPIKEKVTLTKQEIADKFEININQLIIEK